MYTEAEDGGRGIKGGIKRIKKGWITVLWGREWESYQGVDCSVMGKREIERERGREGEVAVVVVVVGMT